ncbi:MAG: hypothetical protein MI864_01565 [Pseudomonadales bacterium]|nr:hypothetical protein [Pseudomonadales bacterium]
MSDQYLDDDYEEHDESHDESECTKCNGDGYQENDDPMWHGNASQIPCQCCGGTGLRVHQTIF